MTLKRKTRFHYLLRVTVPSLFFIFVVATLSKNIPPLAATTSRILTVSPGGSTTSTVCSTSIPCRTIQQAIDLSTPGDTIEILPGVYKAFKVMNKSDLTIRAQSSDVTVLADPNLYSGALVVRIDNSHHITLEGISATNAASAGGMNGRGAFITLSNYITLRNNTFLNNEDDGVTTGNSHNTLIEGNTFFNSTHHGLYISNSSDNITIRKNKLYNIAGSALQVNAAENGLSGEDGISTNVLIEQNTIFNSGQGMNLLGIQDSTIRNNLLWGNVGTGIVLSRDDDACARAPEGPKNINVFHNTVIMGGGARYPIQIKESLGPIRIKNNIFSSIDTNRGFLDIYNKTLTCQKTPSQDIGNTVSDYNIFTGPTARIALNDWQTFKSLAEWQALGKDTHSQTFSDTASLFSDGTSYRLSMSSPARNSGTTDAGVVTDIDDETRPSGSAPDSGSDEFMEPDLTPLSITKVTSRSVVRSGKIISITLRYQNSNQVTVPSVTITDTIPSGFNYIPNSSSGVLQGATLAWNLGSLAPQAEGTLTYQLINP
ncbi:MAG TPA: right-handed parallel beta-helix repeat-containing protein [Patescibacteria group bacterium]